MFFLRFCLCRVPSVGGKPLDLHHLFVEVTSQGGLEKVWLLKLFIYSYFLFAVRFCVHFFRNNDKLPTLLPLFYFFNFFKV